MLKRFNLYYIFILRIIQFYFNKQNIFLAIRDLERLSLIHIFKLELAPTEIFLREFISKFNDSILIHNLLKVGSKHDGGYFISKSPSDYDFLISGGIGKNSDFEYEFAEHNVPVYVFDPTIRSIPRCHKNICWIKKFISNTNSSNKVNLVDFITKKQKTDNYLIKLDIEGDEYKILLPLLKLEPREIVLEIHDTFRLLDPTFRSKFNDIFSLVFKKYFIIHSHGNNNADTNVFGRTAIPDVLELTLLRKDNLAYNKGVNLMNKVHPNNFLLPEIISRPIFLN
jgi:hypothetical protein